MLLVFQIINMQAFDILNQSQLNILVLEIFKKEQQERSGFSSVLHLVSLTSGRVHGFIIIVIHILLYKLLNIIIKIVLKYIQNNPVQSNPAKMSVMKILNRSKVVFWKNYYSKPGFLIYQFLYEPLSIYIIIIEK